MYISNLREYKEGIKYILLANNISKKITDLYIKKLVYQNLVKAYNTADNYIKAYKTTITFKHIIASIFI